MAGTLTGEGAIRIFVILSCDRLTSEIGTDAQEEVLDFDFDFDPNLIEG